MVEDGNMKLEGVRQFRQPLQATIVVELPSRFEADEDDGPPFAEW